MKGFALTIAKIEGLIREGKFQEADEILRPHARFPDPRFIKKITELEDTIVDGLSDEN